MDWKQAVSSKAVICYLLLSWKMPLRTWQKSLSSCPLLSLWGKNFFACHTQHNYLISNPRELLTPGFADLWVQNRGQKVSTFSTCGRWTNTWFNTNRYPQNTFCTWCAKCSLLHAVYIGNCYINYCSKTSFHKVYGYLHKSIFVPRAPPIMFTYSDLLVNFHHSGLKIGLLTSSHIHDLQQCVKGT